MDLNESAGEGNTQGGDLGGKGVCLELKVAREQGLYKRGKEGDRLVELEEEDQRDEVGFGKETELVEDHMVVDHEAEERENKEEVGDRPEEILQRVHEVPVTQLMSHNCNNLFDAVRSLMLLKHGIENDNSLIAPEPIVEGIRVCSPLGGIHDINVFERKLHPLCLFLYPPFQDRVLQLGVLVKHGHDNVGNKHHKEDDRDHRECS